MSYFELIDVRIRTSENEQPVLSVWTILDIQHLPLHKVERGQKMTLFTVYA